jgi:ADP-ribose pyrophosphatase YjhB (NUDIX family)
MTQTSEPQWLTWARLLQAHAQSGLTYCRDPYDIERYRAIRQIAAEIMAAHSETDSQHVLNLFESEIGYATPKVDVRAAVFRDDGILLVREKSDGGWTLPGGWADVGESPGEAVAREVYEESGYRVRAVKLLALHDRNRHGHPPIPSYVYKLFFRCELIENVAPDQLVMGDVEIGGVGFFREDALPELSLSRVVPAQIQRLFEHTRHPEWSADFD